MTALLHHLGVNLRLHLRSRMALLYGYLFPAIFLGAFWVLYRHEAVPLVRHMGELLTVSVLGGACFGLPTTIVSERERGVWRRYRLTPVSTVSLVAGTMLARYVLLITAGLVQLALAMAVGMPMPAHPFDLWVAFTCVSFAFLGMGLVMATMADTVPAVQALGQCIFLPTLVIGGVAVPLAALPDWAQRASAFFPGRYAVELLQASVSGAGLRTGLFSVLALLLIGVAASIAGGKLFRWDARQRFSTLDGKGWLAVALAAWMIVGVTAESRGRVRAPRTPETPTSASVTPAPVATPAALPAPAPASPPPERRASVDTARVAVPTPGPASPGTTPTPTPTPTSAPSQPEPALPTSWQAVTAADIDRDLRFDRLPPDDGIVAPIAPDDEIPEPDVDEHLALIRQRLPEWPPGKVSDPVQRVRNFLYVAAVPDVYQLPLERHMAAVVYERLQADVPKDTLIKVLYWIALHADAGDDSAVDELGPLRLGNGPRDMEQTRERVALYAVKLLGRLLGKIGV